MSENCKTKYRLGLMCSGLKSRNSIVPGRNSSESQSRSTSAVGTVNYDKSGEIIKLFCFVLL